MIKYIVLLFELSILCAAQTTGAYIHYEEASLSSASQKITVQQVASGTRDIHLLSASMWCTADATFTLSRTGTAATATGATIIKLNPTQPSSTVTAYLSSNVGSGTTIRKYDFKVGAPEIVIDLSKITIPRTAGTTGNITISSNSITATCRSSIMWEEIR